MVRFVPTFAPRNHLPQGFAIMGFEGGGGFVSVHHEAEKLQCIKEKIEAVCRQDKRNLQVGKLLGSRLREVRLSSAGMLFEKAGILDGYDESVVLQLLRDNKYEILGGKKHGIHPAD